MAALSPAVAAVRNAVRRALTSPPDPDGTPRGEIGAPGPAAAAHNDTFHAPEATDAADLDRGPDRPEALSDDRGGRAGPAGPGRSGRPGDEAGGELTPGSRSVAPAVRPRLLASATAMAPVQAETPPAGSPTDPVAGRGPGRGRARRAASSTATRPGSARETVLVACSGGADSMALAVGALFVARRMGLGCGLVTVDHGLQEGSARRAADLADWAVERGFAPVQVRAVNVGSAGGPEGAAREARYSALEASAVEFGASMVLLGHTRDDQAETVLLALARGSGPRGLAGMPSRRVRNGVLFVRPLLDVSRAETRAACAAEGLAVWEDPHNADAAYARSRVRPLVAALGNGVVDNLARTARLVGADSAYLDGLAAEALAAALDEGGGLPAVELLGLPEPIRTRVLHAWALRLGSPGTDLSHRHVDALDALVMRWHGQGAVALPGGLFVTRTAGRLHAVR